MTTKGPSTNTVFETAERRRPDNVLIADNAFGITVADPALLS